MEMSYKLSVNCSCAIFLTFEAQCTHLTLHRLVWAEDWFQYAMVVDNYSCFTSRKQHFIAIYDLRTKINQTDFNTEKFTHSG